MTSNTSNFVPADSTERLKTEMATEKIQQNNS